MLSADTYNLWFAPLRASAQETESIILEAANDFCEVWLKENYLGLLRDVLALAAGRQLEVKFQVSPPRCPTEPQPHRGEVEITTSRPTDARAAGGLATTFNPKNTFDTFLVCKSNRSAHAAALAAAKRRGKTWRPVFLFGDVGLGKTHLLHAIGNYVLTHRKEARVAYVSAERFTHEFIDGIQTGQLPSFRRKYREADMLLLDDIQFLAGKERVQEEVFHLIKALCAARKQLVLTCDRPANKVQHLERRLLSRVTSWGSRPGATARRTGPA